MIKISEDGLKARNLGEEKIMQVLYKRAEKLECPAHNILKNTDNLEKIIIDYSKF